MNGVYDYWDYKCYLIANWHNVPRKYFSVNDDLQNMYLETMLILLYTSS